MIRRFENNIGYWCEIRDDGTMPVPYRSKQYSWTTWGQAKMKPDEIADYLINLGFREIRTASQTAQFVIAAAKELANTLTTVAIPGATKKCTCPWDGPNGVYAIGCTCGAIKRYEA